MRPSDVTAWRATLVAVLVVGLVGFAGPATSGATFTDAHDAEGTFAAVDDFDVPVADAGGPYSTFEGYSTELDGTGSTGKNLAYSWTIVDSAGDDSLTDANTATPTYHAPSDVSQDTDATVELTVTDNKGRTDTDTATVTVEDTDSNSDTAPPEISSFTATETAKKEVTVSFDSNETLSSIEVELGKNGVEQVLTESDFSTSDASAPYTYTATTTVSSGGSYTATLTKALDDAGNDGANGQSDAT